MLESDIPNSPKQVGDYTIERTLGVGGMGTVYLARSASGEARAIKVLHAELAGSQELRLRLEREAAVLKRLRGDRSAAVYEINAAAERPYLVMEYVSGLSLDKHIEKYGKLSGVLVWAVMDALLEATEMFHAEGITHRDLKPSNVMLGEDGVKIIDFGISGLMGSSLTEIGSTPATTLWSSPEQMNGAEVGQASDIFNLGMIFAYAWTGSHPFDAAKRDAVMLKLMTGEPNLAGVPSRLRQIVADCLAKDPAQRPSAREVRDRLRLISRSSSNSDSGSRSGDLGSPLTGTVLVNVAEEIQMSSRQQPRQGVALNYRRVSIVVTALLVLLFGAVFASQRNDSGARENATESAAAVATSEATVAVGTLADFKTFRQLQEPGPAVLETLEVDLTQSERFEKEKKNDRYGLEWFDGKCKKNGTFEDYDPIIVQFISPDNQMVDEFRVALDHVARLLEDSKSVLSGTIDTQPVILDAIDTAPIESEISGNIKVETKERNDKIKQNFKLTKDGSRPLRITLSDTARTDVDSRRTNLEAPVRNLHGGLPSGFLVDLGWAVPAREKLSFDPKEIDAAAVTVSSEHWKGVSTEHVLLTLVRALLLGLGSPLDSGSSGILSVNNAEFLRNNYGFSVADYELATELGYRRDGEC